jgi:hypothetical protein
MHTYILRTAYFMADSRQMAMYTGIVHPRTPVQISHPSKTRRIYRLAPGMSSIHNTYIYIYNSLVASVQSLHYTVRPPKGSM